MGSNKKPSHPVYADTRYRNACKKLRTWDHTCHRCGYDIDPHLNYPHPLSWSADHIIPKSLLTAGDPRLWHISNLQAMHLRCNQSRGNKTQPQPRTLDW